MAMLQLMKMAWPMFQLVNCKKKERVDGEVSGRHLL
jgi:hypothetical protein